MILLDIEGTTTPIAFVTSTLVPYARAHIRSYLERNGDSSQYTTFLEAFRREHAADAQARQPVPPWTGSGLAARASVEAYAEWLMSHDRKSPALKELQGYIWEEGYKSGDLVAPVYPDVAPAFDRWRAAGEAIAIFSSGSVLAQRWLFRCSTAGDLTPYVQWYFDTGTGPKRDPASYARIARETSQSPGDILFISDVVAELDAARVTGMRTRLSLRPGNPPQAETDHQTITSFDEIQ